jgi:hypothetical protein
MIDPVIEFVARYPLRITGVVQVTDVVTTGSSPVTVTNVAVESEISGTSIKGIAMKGLKIIGKPNTTVSLMLNMVGTTDETAIRRCCFFLAMIRGLYSSHRWENDKKES